ncbi:MAG: bifunctional 5,10-methylenetetrahydrofolate dehydrogenase/5,10-methenyltetrahydrofolate cyclohydrolase [Acidobacteria bacterium]|nr:MAG: bifunctional 5,10-methylenetetrahydrofolate dehydrogenase/5,10-methenyltetrahydrofolate cyclohydrolase [Acidobacteriota bacterium]
MSATILDGKTVAAAVLDRVRRGAASLLERTGARPGLAVVLVGDNPASEVYVRNKTRRAEECGFASRLVALPASVGRDELLARIGELADDPAVHGMLVQLPLPDHLDAREIQRAVPPDKDVDGFHPLNAGKLLLGDDDGLVPCTPLGVIALLDHYEIPLAGRDVVIVGRSNIVGKPLFHLMLSRHATVTVCHSRTRELAATCARADVLVAAVGVPGLIRGEHVRPGAVVIDVGINAVDDPAQAEDLLAGQPRRLERFRRRGRALVGDVHFGEAREKAGAITPVPGGVGPLTVALLLDNTLRAARRALGVPA